LGQGMLDRYFAQRTAELRTTCLTPYRKLDDWTGARPELQRQLREMLGLDPWPKRTPLNPVITGHIEDEDIRVEKLYFEALPGLYVTANLYLPKDVSEPSPTILYVCGHAIVKEGDRSFGNKVAYQHHGIWFAQHGYVCLVIDTIHRGEIEGIHHGTYSYGMWWWNSRGYSSAGLEAWNSVRALDYLASRPEVDMNRVGITGRSGGGVYSWWTAAIDERIKVAVPVAGITDLHNHVIDGTVAGHCDCMFMVNTYRWDYAQVAALLAPRPLLIANSDKDSIFPLDGVVRLHSQVRDIYRLYDADDKLGLLITEGPHKDTQDLRVPTFRWFNRFLKSTDAPISIPAEKRYSNEQLAVWETAPKDAINKTVQEVFLPIAGPAPEPTSQKAWEKLRKKQLQTLREKSFRSWPAFDRAPTLHANLETRIPEGTLGYYTANVQSRVSLPLYVFVPQGVDRFDTVELSILDEETGPLFDASFRAALQEKSLRRLEEIADNKKAYVWFAPRGIGPTDWDRTPRHHTQIRRRFMLLGETLDSMRVFDIIRAAQSLEQLNPLQEAKVNLTATAHMAVNTLYASLFTPTKIQTLTLSELPSNHRNGPDYLNVSKIWHLDQALAASLSQHSINLIDSSTSLPTYARTLHQELEWDTTLQITTE
jgi:dienelactone hydrolase